MSDSNPSTNLQSIPTNDGSGASSSPYRAALKILVSNGVAGSIIGKGGSTISELQNLTGCRIKLSNSGEYYPGTNERICLVQGNIGLARQGLDTLLRKFVLINDSISDGGSDREGGERIDNVKNYHLRVLIPSGACGLLIGKSGKHIKSISIASQTRIQLGQKEDVSSITTSERIFSISGGKENVLRCVDILWDCVEKEMEEVESDENSVWRYVNGTTNYNKNPATGAERVGNRGGVFGDQIIVPRESLEKMLDRTTLIQGSGLLSPPVVDGNTSNNDSGPQVIGGQLSPTVLPVLPPPDMGGVPSSSSSARRLGNSTVPSIVDYTTMPTSPASASSVAYAAAQARSSQQQQLFKLEEAVLTDADRHSITLAVPDYLVGSIIGQSGSTLTQLQLCSQTRIQISQRGEYVPGTNNRFVKIVGNKKENCDAAQFWIGQRIMMAEEGLDHGGVGGRGCRGRGRYGRGGGRGGRHEKKDKNNVVMDDRNNTSLAEE